jgi:thioredoxin reductase
VIFLLILADGTGAHSRSVVIATGVSYRRAPHLAINRMRNAHRDVVHHAIEDPDRISPLFPRRLPGCADPRVTGRMESC